MREATITRKTKETDISVYVNLDGTGQTNIHTGIGFFDHMLTALCVHGGFDFTIQVDGDLEVDCHHTIEDTGIVLGTALKQALSASGPIERYGSFYIPMDEALGFVSLDISNRPYLVWDCTFTSDMIGEFDTQMAEEFFRSFAYNAGITLHARVLYGKNDHHKAEAVFKALAHSLKAAVRPKDGAVLSTKGVL